MPSWFVITEAGMTEVHSWLAGPAEPEPHLLTVLFSKVILALLLGGPAERYEYPTLMIICPDPCHGHD